jgi:surface protein
MVLDFEVVTPPINMCLPFNTIGVSVVIFWGDSPTPQVVEGASITNVDHTYTTRGNYTISIDRWGPGPIWLRAFSSGYECWYNRLYPWNNARLTKVVSFGDLGLKSLSFGFESTAKLYLVPPVLPATATDLTYAFSNSRVNSPGFRTWDVSNVNQMAGMFSFAIDFNQNIESWNVSKITTMRSMFEFCQSFSQPLAAWDVSRVTDLYGAFQYTYNFNQPLDSWNVSRVTDMTQLFMFGGFNQPLGGWDVSRVTAMASTFQGTPFNQPLDTWDVSRVTDFTQTFLQARNFNQPLNGWNMSSATRLYRMFESSVYNLPLDAWDTSKVTTIGGIFGASLFDQPIDSWDVANVELFDSAFISSAFNQPLSSWNVRKGTSFNNMFDSAVFQQNISNWCSPLLTAAPVNFAPNLNAAFRPNLTNCPTPPVSPPTLPPPAAAPANPPEAAPQQSAPVSPPQDAPFVAPPVAQGASPQISPPVIPILAPTSPPACAGSTCITQNVTVSGGDVVTFQNVTVVVGDFKIVSSTATVSITVPSSGSAVPLQITGCAQFQGSLNITIASNTDLPSSVTLATFQDGYCGGEASRTSFDNLNVDSGCRKARSNLQYNPKSLTIIFDGVDNSTCNANNAGTINLPGIIGGVVAAAIVIIIVISVVVIYLRHKRMKRESKEIQARIQSRN